MKRALIFSGLFIIISALCWSQDTITLEQCYAEATAIYPLSNQYDLIEESHDLKMKNIKAGNYPQLNLNGQMSYQSEVTAVVIELPDNPYFSGEDLAPPPIDKDWYKASLDVNQPIYNGSTNTRQKELEKVNYEIDKQQINVELYKLKERINDIYFSVLLIQRKLHLLDVMINDLDEKLDQLEAMIKNGVLIETEADVLKAEIIKIKQEVSATKWDMHSAKMMLQELTAIEMHDNIVLNTPNPVIDLTTYDNQRPEYALLDMQKEQLNAMEGLV